METAALMLRSSRMDLQITLPYFVHKETVPQFRCMFAAILNFERSFML